MSASFSSRLHERVDIEHLPAIGVLRDIIEPGVEDILGGAADHRRRQLLVRVASVGSTGTLTPLCGVKFLSRKSWVNFVSSALPARRR